jgi:hypothetical protein
MLANAETKWAVLSAFNALIGHIANGRVSETAAAFTDDADVALFGSEVSDRAIGASDIRTHFVAIYARPYRVLFDMTPGKVSAHGNVAWMTADGVFRLSTGDEQRRYRLTLVFERRQGRWLIQLFCGSEPVD